MRTMKLIGKGLLVLLLILVAFVAIYAIYMQSHYYRIPDHQKLHVGNNPGRILEPGKQYTATTYNIGFGAYNQHYTFFMDNGQYKPDFRGGKKTRGKYGKAVSKQAVLDSTNGVARTIKRQQADFMLFQEIDTNSTRSYHVNQVRRMEQAFPEAGHVFAKNFHQPYILVPPQDPHGAVQSGILTISRYHIGSAVRRKYPIDMHFIAKFVDLDRCFAVMRLPVKGGHQLILINSHMSAYDKGGRMRKLQMSLLGNFIKHEYKNGNYVIVGGDYNHALGDTMLHHFKTEEELPSWISVLNDSMLPKQFHIVKAENRNSVPTVRSTDITYQPGINYYSVIDGFIVSKNVTARTHNLNTHFKYSDHNPVKMTFELQPEGAANR